MMSAASLGLCRFSTSHCVCRVCATYYFSKNPRCRRKLAGRNTHSHSLPVVPRPVRLVCCRHTWGHSSGIRDGHSQIDHAAARSCDPDDSSTTGRTVAGNHFCVCNHTKPQVAKRPLTPAQKVVFESARARSESRRIPKTARYPCTLPLGRGRRPSFFPQQHYVYAGKPPCRPA